MAISLNSISTFTSTKLQAKHKDASRYSFGASLPKSTQFAPFFVTTQSRILPKEKRFGHCFSVADSDQLAADSSSNEDFGNAENPPANDNHQLTSKNASDENSQLQAKVNAESVSQTSEGTNESINQKGGSAASPNSQSTVKRPSLTARERLRAARVLSRYTESKAAPTKSDMGSRVLDALKESDKGKKRSRLPEAPTNLFDDSKRGLPKQGLTFQFPGGSDLFFIVFSFVFISTVMFATTYFVWKVGAIHFNEY